MIIGFKHTQSAHCENGATANLLRFYGIDISEAMVFGIGSGLFFAYMPFLKHNGIPASSFRPLPGMIFKRTATLLGIKIYRKKFHDPEVSMAALDQALDHHIPVGLQVGVFHLTYFPRPYRFHFNAHNLVVYGNMVIESLIESRHRNFRVMELFQRAQPGGLRERKRALSHQRPRHGKS
jgi:hypothetical protein